MHLRIFLIAFLFAANCNAQVMQAAGLSYIVQQPKIQSVKPPLLILLHGYGSNEQDLMNVAGRLPGEFTVVAARAPITISSGSYAWYHLNMAGGKTTYDSLEAEHARQQLFRFIDEVKSRYNASDVLLMGFSQGAIMSYSVALTRPHTIKGIIALSGRILVDIDKYLAPVAELRRLNIFIGHGTSDQVLPLFHGEAASLKCKKLETNVTFREYPMGHEISFPELADIQQWVKTLFVK